MKKILFFAFYLISIAANATTYYVSSSSGSDANNGTSTSTPWQSITKVNSFGSFAAGDNILFKRGDTFYGEIVVSNNGTSGNPITYGAYGTGAKPIITGFTTLSGWTAYNTNIQEASFNTNHLEVVLVDGKPTARGRWPNTGFYTYTLVTNQASISDAAHLTGTPNWTGAELVMRKSTWTLSRDSITSQSGSTLNFAAGSNWETMSSGWGYFIQNSLSTLDQNNEWYEDGSHFYIWLGGGSGSSHTIQVGTQKILINIDTKSYISVSSLQFVGSDSLGARVVNAPGVTFDSCDFKYIGNKGFFSWYHSSPTISNCTFDNCYANAIVVNSDNYSGVFKNNTITNTGTIMGTGVWGAGNGGFDTNGDGIVCSSPATSIRNNIVDSTGHMGIRISNINDTIQNNFINYTGLIRDDVGGIYAWSKSAMTGSLIDGNVVLNGVGNTDGIKTTDFVGAEGIYLDYVEDIKITNNTVANNEMYGFLINGSKNIEVHDNLSYNARDYGFQTNEKSTSLDSNINITRNKFIAKDSSNTGLPRLNSGVFHFYSSANSSFPNFGTIDSNYYARPVDDNLINMNYLNGTWTTYSLSSWQTATGKDAHSHKSAKTAANTDSLLFVYNPTDHDSTVSLAYKYEQVDGTINDGSITLTPYSSAVLIQNGSVSVASITMSPNQTVSVQPVTVSCTATPSSGQTISSYSWTQTAGATANIASPSSSSTNISGLSGTSTFRCTVTQSNGGISYGEVSITLLLNRYYISVLGNSSNNGTSASTPWDLATLNSSQSSLSSGDSILFNKGETFNGQIIVGRAGTSVDPIVYASYGTGAAPIISGSTLTISAWHKIKDNIYTSDQNISNFPNLNVLIISGSQINMGQTPNSGTYYHYQSFNSNSNYTSITSNDLNGKANANWTGSQAIVIGSDNNQHIYNITAQSGKTLYLTSDSSITLLANNGFFIRDNIKTLDTNNEWYYDRGLKRIIMYNNTSIPPNVTIPTIQNLFYDSSYDYIHVNNLTFQYSNGPAIYIAPSHSDTTGCTFQFTGN